MIDLSKIPTSPGVYLHKDKEGTVIYVGKAKSLRKRVASYTKKQDHPRTALLCKNIAKTDFIITRNEVEALILENQLIKKYSPRYNVMLKDGKQYAYIHVTDERAPKIVATRRRGKKGKYFGPYPSSIYKTVQLARNLFAIRSCKNLPKKVCLNYHIGLCTGPCENKVSDKEYQLQIKHALDFLSGNTDTYEKEFEKIMKQSSENLDYERAKVYRDKLFAVQKLKQEQEVDSSIHRHQDVIGVAFADDKALIALLQIRRGVIIKKQEYTFDFEKDILDSFVKQYYSVHEIPHEIICPPLGDTSIVEYLTSVRKGAVKMTTKPTGAKKALFEIAKKNAFALAEEENPVLMELQEKLYLNTIPKSIECFDISNYGAALKVGACVSFFDGKPLKSKWRKYIVKTVEGQDDFQSMYEVVKRRYAKMELPDLIVIDGGTQQVTFALKALKELGKQVPLVGLAKKEETIVFPGGKEQILNRRLDSSKLLIKIRDETHRFVVSFARQKYRKTMSVSELDSIEGIGKETKYKLLSHFGSVAKIKKASEQELIDCIGKKGSLVYSFFHEV